MDNDMKDPSLSGHPRNLAIRRIRILWVALIVYFVIMLNAFRYVYVAPYQAVILGALMNMAIIIALVVALKRAYRSLAR